MKKKYIALETEITEFDVEDVITASRSDITDGDEDEEESQEKEIY